MRLDDSCQRIDILCVLNKIVTKILETSIYNVLSFNYYFYNDINIIFCFEIFHFDSFFDDDVIRAIQKNLNAKNVVIEVVVFYENEKNET